MTPTPITPGLRFGRLLVLSRAGSNRHGQALWLCRCDCGQETTVLAHSFRNGNTRSCGCLQRDTVAATGRAPGSHRRRIDEEHTCREHGSKGSPSAVGTMRTCAQCRREYRREWRAGKRRRN